MAPSAKGVVGWSGLNQDGNRRGIRPMTGSPAAA